jgi:hypothetical protein
VKPKVGDVVRIERDETRFPSRGSWPQFRGRTGTVVEVNRDRNNALRTEFGVVFGSVTQRRDRPGAPVYANDSVVWFMAHELTVCTAAVSRAGRRSLQQKVSGTGDRS